jgi:hypothetical protein
MTNKRAPKMVKYCPNPDCVARIQLRAWMDIDGDRKCAACNKRMYREFLDEKPTREKPASPVCNHASTVNIHERWGDELVLLRCTWCQYGKTERYEWIPPVKADDPAKAKGFGGKQVGGTHYGESNMDPFAYADYHQLNAAAGRAVAYVTRLGKKGERPQWVLDARKGIQCIERRCLDLGITLEELYGE